MIPRQNADDSVLSDLNKLLSEKEASNSFKKLVRDNIEVLTRQIKIR